MLQPVWYNQQEQHTKVIEAPWGQPLREVGGKQETGEEGEEEVVTVAGQTVARATASPAAEKDLHAEITKIFSNQIHPENTKTQQIYFRCPYTQNQIWGYIIFYLVWDKKKPNYLHNHHGD